MGAQLVDIPQVANCDSDCIAANGDQTRQNSRHGGYRSSQYAVLRRHLSTPLVGQLIGPGSADNQQWRRTRRRTTTAGAVDAARCEAQWAASASCRRRSRGLCCGGEHARRDEGVHSQVNVVTTVAISNNIKGIVQRVFLLPFIAESCSFKLFSKNVAYPLQQRVNTRIVYSRKGLHSPHHIPIERVSVNQSFVAGNILVPQKNGDF